MTHGRGRDGRKGKMGKCQVIFIHFLLRFGGEIGGGEVVLIINIEGLCRDPFILMGRAAECGDDRSHPRREKEMPVDSFCKGPCADGDLCADHFSMILAQHLLRQLDEHLKLVAIGLRGNSDRFPPSIDVGDEADAICCRPGDGAVGWGEGAK